jgi:CrcB protein
MMNILAVGLGSCLGGIARYLLSPYGNALFRSSGFPAGTLIVNVLGCFCIGLLAQVFEEGQWSSSLRLFLLVGVLGGFTTFSAFSLETLRLFQTGDVFLAGTNVLISVFLCLLACSFGIFLGSRFV